MDDSQVSRLGRRIEHEFRRQRRTRTGTARNGINGSGRHGRCKQEITDFKENKEEPGSSPDCFNNRWKPRTTCRPGDWCFSATAHRCASRRFRRTRKGHPAVELETLEHCHLRPSLPHPPGFVQIISVTSNNFHIFQGYELRVWPDSQDLLYV